MTQKFYFWLYSFSVKQAKSHIIIRFLFFLFFLFFFLFLLCLSSRSCCWSTGSCTPCHHSTTCGNRCQLGLSCSNHLEKKFIKFYDLQGCCLTGTWSPEAPKLRVRATKVLFKEPEWAPKHGVFIPSNLSDEIGQNHSHNKLNGKQQLLWSCFAFNTRNMGQNTSTKSLSAHKTTENSDII